MIKCIPGPLKSKDDRKQLIIKKLKIINNTKIIINAIEKNNIDNAIIESNKINLNSFIINKIKRLK